MKILLIGNPNVGKSVVFSRLTGADVISSNYPGTTVEITRGSMRVNGKTVELIDTPGAYCLKPTCKAEGVTSCMVKELQEGDIVINVVDATNLERNLYLTLELLEKKIPVIVALNMWDDAKHLGIKIDTKKLEEFLGVPVVPTVAVTGEGIKELVFRINDAKSPEIHRHNQDERWADIGKIISEVQRVTHRHHTPMDRISDATIRPLTGIPLGLIILLLTFVLIINISEFLINNLLDPFFEHFYIPLITDLVDTYSPSEILTIILIGDTPELLESFGLLTTGVYIPFAVVLPYVLSFYFFLSLLEDVGYLPRLSVLVDNVMHRIGLHGFAIVPTFLGLGCNVPGALALRVLETREQRFIAATLISIAVPCAAQQAMIVGVLGGRGILPIFTVYLTLVFLYVIVGYFLNRIIKGEKPELLLEIPPYRMPDFLTLSKKTWMRLRYFLTEAVPFVLLGIFMVNILYISGIMGFLSLMFGPVSMNLFGLPSDAIAALLVGFLRKDVAVGMLLALGMTTKQLIIAVVILSIYFPCVATFTVLLKELGFKDTVKSASVMLITVLIVGGFLNLIL